MQNKEGYCNHQKSPGSFPPGLLFRLNGYVASYAALGCASITVPPKEPFWAAVLIWI